MNFGNTNIFTLLFRITLMFITLLTLTRLLGKKQMSQLTYFNYVTGITIGSIAANIISQSTQSFMDEFIGLAWWCVLTSLAGYISLKSGTVRLIIDGQPTILIKKGHIMKAALNSTRLNIDDLTMLLRKQNVFSVTEVEYAILEPNGNLSVMKKQPNQQLTKGDMNIAREQTNHIPCEIITDGRIIWNNLKELNLDEQWLKTQLKNAGIASKKEVFYAEIQNDSTLYIEKNP